MSFFLQSKVFDEKIPGFSPYNALHLAIFIGGNQTIQGPKDTLSANCKLFKGL